LYATFYPAASTSPKARLGAVFGALIGIFSIGSFVIHNYVNLQIGLKLTMQQSAAYFIDGSRGIVMASLPSGDPLIEFGVSDFETTAMSLKRYAIQTEFSAGC